MRKTFKKSLIYLLFTMLLLPTWLVTEMVSATHAKAAGPSVIINEFMPNPASGDNEWAELYNTGNQTVSLENWSLRDSDGNELIKFNLTDSITPGEYLSVELTSNNLSPSEDTISLYDSSGSLSVDDKSYKANPGTGKSIGRTFDGSDEWIVFSNPTKGSANLIANISPISGSVLLNKNQSYSFPVTVTPRASYQDVSALVFQMENYNFDQLFSQFDLDGVDQLVAAKKIIYPTTGFDLVFGTPITTTTDLTVIDNDTIGSFNFDVMLIDSNDNIISDIATYHLTINDTTAPVITLNGPSDITIELGSVYAELGATAIDNKDGAVSVSIDASAVNTAMTGDYQVKYSATDVAGNNSTIERTIHVVEAVIESPQISVSVSDKMMTVSWDEVGGATDYLVYIGTSTSNWIINGVSTFGSTSYSTTFASYGDYVVRVIAVKNLAQSTVSDGVNQKTVSVQYVAPVVEKTVEAVTVAPEVAVASEPTQPTPTITTPSNGDMNDDGEIKGEEESATDETDINWTPWIILFILIILAGAATGGYFYWFGGEDEVEKVVKSEKPREAKKETTAKKNNNKKIKRW